MSAVAPRVKTRHRGIYTRGEGRNLRYIVWYADSDGKGRTVTLPAGSSEKDALAKQAELRGKVYRGERVAPTKVTLGEFAERWLADQEGRVKDETLKSYRFGIKHLEPLKRTKLHELSVDDVARLVAGMQRKGYKAWSIRRVLTTLSRIMTIAIRRGLAHSNPVAGLDRTEKPKNDQKRMRILSSEEIDTLLRVVPELWRPLITTLVFTGMRISEALSLEWRDVDFEAGLVTVRTSKTEAGEGRQIVLIPSLASVLRRHKLASGFSRDDELVFCTRDGRPLDRANTLAGALRRKQVLEAIGKITQHELRHTYASILIGQGLDVTFVADQLGHADPGITLRTYAKLFDPKARRDEARERLELALGGLV